MLRAPRNGRLDSASPWISRQCERRPQDVSGAELVDGFLGCWGDYSRVSRKCSELPYDIEPSKTSHLSAVERSLVPRSNSRRYAVKAPIAASNT